MQISYCLLTGGRCPHCPINVELNTFFISEPYDQERKQREQAIKDAIKGFKFVVADHRIKNIALTCKICQEIQSSQFGVVDVTGCNENVLIELGMLYGFNKPTVIIIKKTEKTEIEVPSNIKGIEQVRYSNFDDLVGKLKDVISVFLELWKKEEDFLVDLRPAIKAQISDIELAIETRALLKMSFESSIVDFKIFGDVALVIINKGAIHGVRNEMLLRVYRCDTTIGQENLEEDVGLIVVTHVQDRISQCQFVQVDPNNSFWKAVFTSVFPKNLIRPYLRNRYRELSDNEMQDLLRKTKIIENYI